MEMEMEIPQNELNLYETKWYDYRPYTPEACDLMFAKEWLVAREAFYKRTGLDVRFDGGGKKYRLPLKWKGLADLKADAETWKGLQVLRRTADKHGAPYKLFWQITFRVLVEMDAWRNEIEAAATPFIKASILEEFKEFKAARILMSHDDAMQGNNYVGEPFQNAYMEYLAREVVKRYPATARDKLEVLVNENRLAARFVGQIRNGVTVH